MVSYCARWLHHWVWLLGEEEEASHYLYEITAFKGNTKWVEHFVDLILIFCILMNCFPFRYIYISEVASLRTSDDEIVSEGEYLSKSCILVSASECFVLGRKKKILNGIINPASGKCLSISDAIGKRLRDGDKIRYKVQPGSGSEFIHSGSGSEAQTFC